MYLVDMFFVECHGSLCKLWEPRVIVTAVVIIVAVVCLLKKPKGLRPTQPTECSSSHLHGYLPGVALGHRALCVCGYAVTHTVSRVRKKMGL